MDMAGTDVGDVISQFMRAEAAAEEVDGEVPEGREALVNLEGADATFFSEIVKASRGIAREIDPLVDQQLRTGWRLVRVDSILRAILRGGVFELLERRDVPARVTINEYINIAKARFSRRTSPRSSTASSTGLHTKSGPRNSKRRARGG